MRRLLLLCLGVSTALPVIATAQSPRDASDQSQASKLPAAREPSTGSAHMESYRLAAQDSVRITVFGEEDLSTTARVGRDLSIAMPLIGLVKIGGQTVRDAAGTIESRLREYLIKPQVAVAIIDYSKRRFTILGQVNRPGTLDLPDENSIDLMEAIGMAGGYSRIANPSKITIKRSTNGEQTIYKIDGKDMLNKEATERFQVMPGDTILVGERIF